MGSKKGTTSITDMAKQNIDIWRMQKSLPRLKQNLAVATFDDSESSIAKQWLQLSK